MADSPNPRRRRVWLWAGLVSAFAVGAIAISSWPDSTHALLVGESGGEGTTSSADLNAFGDSARNLTNDQRRTFEVGDSFFTQNWVTAPASTEARDGLGPLLNARSCSSCHLRDGRGTPDGNEPGLLFRISVPGVAGPGADPIYGDQLQDRSILGVPAEGAVRTIYVDVEGAYEDGTGFTLRRPMHVLEDLAYGPISVEVMVSPRLALPVIGMGLLQAIPEEDILGLADPDDSDGDGISGRPNLVAGALGRFGWKANVTTVEHQVAAAFLGDIGITSDLAPNETCTLVQTACLEAPHGGIPEIAAELFDNVVFYAETLAVPARRDLDDPEVRAGARRFLDLGCGSCHTPSHVTGDDENPALAGQAIFPYTDLLLHDMGPDLADDRPDGLATGSEWRTPPLWGLGLNEVVNGHEFFLHDGRARSVEEAILWHGGEAETSKDGFMSLTSEQRQQLLAFLSSL